MAASGFEQVLHFNLELALVDLCMGQLGLVGIEKSRDTKGVYIKGIKVREKEADSNQLRPVTQDTVIPSEDIPPF